MLLRNYVSSNQSFNWDFGKKSYKDMCHKKTQGTMWEAWSSRWFQALKFVDVHDSHIIIHSTCHVCLSTLTNVSLMFVKVLVPNSQKLDMVNLGPDGQFATAPLSKSVWQFWTQKCKYLTLLCLFSHKMNWSKVARSPVKIVLKLRQERYGP